MAPYLPRNISIAVLFASFTAFSHAAAADKSPATPVATKPVPARTLQDQREIALANLMLQNGHPDAACKILHATTPPASVDPDRYYLLARCSAELKQIDAAIGYYRKTIELQPDAPRPRAELAAIYLAIEQYAAAAPLFADTARLIPPGETAESMRSLAERLGANDPAALLRGQSAKPWSIEMFAGLTKDDNVNGGPVSRIVPTVIGGTPINFMLSPAAMPRSSWGATASVNGNYSVPLNRNWSVLFQGGLAATHYFSESDFSNDSLSLAAAFIYRDKSFSASVQPNVRYVRQHGRTQEATPGIVGRLSKALSPTLTATGSVGYFDRTVQPDGNRDAKGWHGSVGLVSQLSKTVQVGGEYEVIREDASLDVHSRRLHGPSVFAAVKVIPELTLIANYRYAAVEHDERMALFSGVRKDRQKIAVLTGLWDVSRWAGRDLAVRAQYMHIENPSNIAFNDYKRNLFIVGVQTKF